MAHKLSYLSDMMKHISPLLKVFSASPRGAGSGVDFTERHPAPVHSHLMRLRILDNAAVVEGLCSVSLRDRQTQGGDLPPPGRARLFSLLLPFPFSTWHAALTLTGLQQSGALTAALPPPASQQPKGSGLPMTPLLTAGVAHLPPNTTPTPGPRGAPVSTARSARSQLAPLPHRGAKE